jgi:zinc/manganese transport system substrate-binding protein
MKALRVSLAALATAWALVAIPGPWTGAAVARVRVAASTTDLASIAATVGGDQVEATAIARSNADPHRVEVLPSYMVRVSRAQMYLKVGLGLDLWADAIIDGSHNAKLVVIDASKGVRVLEQPTGKVDASMGDVHPNGNPHYWLDPRNAAAVARTIAEALSQVDPAHAADFAARAEQLGRDADDLLARGREMLSGLPSREILTYHRSWSYLADAFDLNVAGTIEPIPGIPPTGRHLQELVEIIRERRVAAVLAEPYFSDDAGEYLARETGVNVIRLSPACDDASAGSYVRHIEAVLAAVAAASRGGSTPPAPRGDGK